MNKLRTILVGTGYAGEHLHLPALSKNRSVEVVALVDLDAGKCRQLCKQYSIPRSYTDISEALEAENPEVVSIATPPATHFPLVRKVIAKDRIVFVEKPIFQTIEEAETIRNESEEAGCQFIPIHNKTAFPAVSKAIKLAEAGKLGIPKHFEAFWMVRGSDNHMCKNPNHWSHKLTGGRWEELIPHPIYLAYRFVGPMKLLNVDTKRTDACLPWMDFDEVRVFLKGANGTATVTLSSGLERKRSYNFFQVFGSRHSLTFTHRYCHRDIVDFELLSTFRSAISMILAKAVSALPSASKGKHDNFFRQAIDSMREDPETNFISWEEALNTLSLTAEISTRLKTLST